MYALPMRKMDWCRLVVFVIGVAGGVLKPATSFCQEINTNARSPSVYFPQPMGARKWRRSLGIIFTTTPQEVTEETRLRIPAIDFQILRRLKRNMHLTGRLNAQVLQNHVSLGIRWVHPLSEKVGFALGDDVGFWAGYLNITGFNNRGYGFLNYPHASLGYRFGGNLLLTFKAEALLNLHYSSYVGRNALASDQNLWSGFAFTWVLEQPFYHRQHFMLGIRAMYTDFNWQFWSLYETFERRTFYPQFMLGFIL